MSVPGVITFRPIAKLDAPSSAVRIRLDILVMAICEAEEHDTTATAVLRAMIAHNASPALDERLDRYILTCGVTRDMVLGVASDIVNGDAIPSDLVTLLLGYTQMTMNRAVEITLAARRHERGVKKMDRKLAAVKALVPEEPIPSTDDEVIRGG